MKPHLISLAARQHGLLTHDQWLGAGLSRQAWYRALAAGRLVGVHPGVARLPGAPESRNARIHAAVLSIDGAIASHRSAAVLWGVELPGRHPVDVIVGDRHHHVRRTGVVVHRPTDLADLRPVVRDGIPTANPLRLLVDIGAVLPEAAGQVLESLVIAGHVSRSSATGALHRHARKGRAGVGPLRRALQEWSVGDRPPDSVLETAMAALLRRSGLPQPELHARVLGLEVDFAFHLAKVIVEVDGWDVHGTRDAFEEDRARDALLAANGWIVLRFTWLQVVRRPDDVARRIGAVLFQRAAATA